MKKLFAPLLFAAWLAAVLAACNREKDEVPDVHVDFYINTTDPGFIDLNSVGGWVYVTGGSKGIIIYRKSVNEFMAYDRHCTYQPSNACSRCEVDTTNNLFVFDNCCGSKFLITDGSVQQGPAHVPLKAYRTSFDGLMLHVYN
ncbi:MAG: hypothetical protein AB1458_10200 [Bacteroidota bacterium]